MKHMAANVNVTCEILLVNLYNQISDQACVCA